MLIQLPAGWGSWLHQRPLLAINPSEASLIRIWRACP